jgi:hypothetical protein
MSKSSQIRLSLLIGSIFIVSVGCREDREIRSYRIPKETPSKISFETPPTAPTQRPKLSWTKPEKWQEGPASQFRVGSFKIPGPDGKAADISVIPLPGESGSEVENVNRWRREIGLAELNEKDVSGETVAIGDHSGKLYELTGSIEGNAVKTVAAMYQDGTVTWFFKMRGDTSVVDSSKTDFLAFLRSIKFGHAHEAGGHDHSDPAHQHDHGAETTEAPQFPWTVPAHWQTLPPTQMVLAKYLVPGANKEDKAEMSVTVFPGDVGGGLANVNRWAGQLGLPAMNEEEMTKVTTAINVADGKGMVADLTGTDVKTSKKARMVAVMVPRGERTWFFKLMGDASVIAAEKDHFLKTVQSAQLP